MIWVIAVIIFIMLLSALAVILIDNTVSAIVATSLVSLLLSMLFVLLQAPDVAMTEAVVGSGLSTVILALALRRLGSSKQTGEESDA